MQLLSPTQSHTRATLLTGALIVVIMALLASCGQFDESETTPIPPTATPPIPTDLAPDAVTDRAFPSITYGIHAFLWWDKSIRPLDLDNVQLMQFTHIKQRFVWDDIQPEPDHWIWDQADAVVKEMNKRGLEIVARLDGPPEWALADVDDPTVPPVDLTAWSTYCGTLAGRYAGDITAYQVWNEPNLNREWEGHPPNAEAYVTLLAACTDAIRARDPEAVIISAGLAPTGTWLPEAIPDMDYLRMMYAAGAAPYFDVLGLNAPGYGAPPELSPDEAENQNRLRWMTFRHVEDMRAIMVEEGDAHKQVALLEVGWTTDQIHESYAWHAVDPEVQAEYLVNAYRYAAMHWRPWIGLMTTIFLADSEWTEDDEEYWWAINETGYGAAWKGRPAYYQLSWMEHFTDDTYIPARHPGYSDEITRLSVGENADLATMPEIIAPDLTLITLDEGVYVISHTYPWPGNSLLVEMANGALVLVDTPYTPEATQHVLDFIAARFGDREIVAINSHFHADNLGGNPALIEAGIPVYGSDLTAQLVAQRGAKHTAQLIEWTAMDGMQRYHDSYAAMTLVPPTNVFALDDGLDLTFGDESVQVIYPGPGHAPDNVVVYFPDKRVLFGGCLIIGGEHVGNTTDADLAAWPDSVAALRTIQADWVIPGHGTRFDVGLIDHTMEILAKHP